MKQKNTQDTEKKPKTSKKSATSTKPKKAPAPKKPRKPAVKKVEEPAPEYQTPLFEEPKKTLTYSSLIAYEPLLNALEHSSYSSTTQELSEILPAVMRGSHTMIYKTKQTEDFLISCLPALSNNLQSDDRNNKLNVLVFPTLETAELMNDKIRSTFQSLKFHSSTSYNDQSLDILLTTPQNLETAFNSNVLQTNQISLVCFYELDELAQNKSNLKDLLLKLNKAQFIFIAHKNSPQVREIAFEFLNNPEVFSFLPNDVVEQYPRQFSHALEATQKFQVLLGYIKTFRPRSALVVANTKSVAEWIAYKLHGNSIKVALLTTPFESREARSDFLNKITNGEFNIFVTTDFMLQNLAFENLHCVYHFDLPEKPNLYLNRLNKIVGSRNPISIAFICEDYGYNMGKIEDFLGFKIRLTRPDKNFFKFKDESDYPLHENGKVKQIGEKSEQKSQEAQEVSKPTVVETQQVPAQKVEVPKPRHERVERPHPQHAERSYLAAKPKENKQTKHFQPDTSKFVRRDERAREAVADALQAAKQAEEKRNAFKAQQKHYDAKSSAKSTQSSLFGAVISVFVESVKAGLSAGKESFVQHSEEKLPKLHKFFKKRSKK